ncbi:YhgE/Pip domain-containing protein [Leucobacter sp. CSA2]|uniref:YhgE/Pip domain-containing protein n=1 Tax=Leucobacter edaphi TaxID=2796472 RepID=A0A934QBZ0_9MICO|nr:YhgE/Pip domain-containing protein [Leucobacter edaphi]MBK0421844.1 YhgE/Pip domain-containing protein [Leucobacter edaphi]
MKIFQIVTAEFRRLLSTKMSVLALVALICVPILYGGLYLWANQDPYAKLTNVPVALIVEDEGANVAGKHRTIGREVADELLKSDTFDWHDVDERTAKAGLDDGGYDFAVKIPADFTESITSIQGKDPHAADIVLLTNDANNYLASTIGKQAVEKIRTTVAEKVVDEAGLTMLDALNTIRISLVDAAKGAGQLHDGLGDAVDGAGKLHDGASKLADGNAQIHDGAKQLAAGNAQLSDGLVTLTDGAQQVHGGTAKLAQIADSIDDEVQGAAGKLPGVRTDIQKRLTDRGYTQAEVNDVLAAIDPIGSDLTAAAGRVQNARSEIDRLNSGADQVAGGAAQLSAGAKTAASGSAQLADATGTAAAGSAELRDGIGTLQTGLKTAEDGAGKLATGLSDGAKKIPDTDEATRKAQAKTLADPVSISNNAITQAQNYGAGLAPFFAALAAWIGIYALFLIVKPISKRAVTALNAPIRVTIAGWATPALLGALQMLGLFGVLAITLGFQFANPLATFGLLVLASATYTAIILALNVWLGSVGQFIGLILMVLQLVTAGGTFPWQTLPAPLASLHHILPMGYVVDAMRQVMYSGAGWDRVGADIGVIVIWLLAALLAAVIGVGRMTRRQTLRDLQPSLIG